MLIAALADGAGVVFNNVDIFNVATGAWSSAALSVPRGWLAATSLPNHALAIFAGGKSTSCVCFFIYEMQCSAFFFED
jgi:hypothetical protein